MGATVSQGATHVKFFMAVKLVHWQIGFVQKAQNRPVPSDSVSIFPSIATNSLALLAGCGPEPSEQPLTQGASKLPPTASPTSTSIPQNLRAAIITNEQQNASEEYFANVIVDDRCLDFLPLNGTSVRLPESH